MSKFKHIIEEVPSPIKKNPNTPSAVEHAVPPEYSGGTISQPVKKANLEDLYKNPYKEGEIMPCCGQRYCFSYDRMKYLPRNPNLKYRTDGTIDVDPHSSQPRFCDYNGAREAIRQAKIKGLDHVHWRVSTAMAEALQRDGYFGYGGGPLMNKNNDMICWKTKKGSSGTSGYGGNYGTAGKGFFGTAGYGKKPKY
jgi:hypothetical protein